MNITNFGRLRHTSSSVLFLWLGLFLVSSTCEIIAGILTVSNGSGGGNYPAGTVVSISANPPAPGYAFDKWTGASVATPLSSTTKITVPGNNIFVTATFKVAIASSWELWADTTDGLPLGGFPTIAINSNHDIYFSAWATGNAVGYGRVWKAAAEDPHHFFPISANNFNLDPIVQDNVNDLAINGAGEPVAAAASLVGSTTNSVVWTHRFDSTNQAWLPSQFVGTNYFYNIRMIESDPTSGAVWAVGDSSAVWWSDNGDLFSALDQQSLLPNDLRGGGPPRVREYSIARIPSTSRYPEGVLITAGENNGLVCTLDGGVSWQSIDPNYLNPVSPLARVHPLYDATVPNQVLSGAGDIGGLGWRTDGKILVQSPGAFGYGGIGLNGAGGTDATRLYAFWLNRPDLPVLVASGVADNIFAGGQGVQSQSIRCTRSGWSFIESPSYPDGVHGGLYMSPDGIHWQNASDGIIFPPNPKPLLLSSGGRSSIAIDDEDVFMAVNGRMYHTVPPGTNRISGFVVDSNNQPISNAIVKTAYGQWAVSDADGSYSITNVGASLYPTAILVSSTNFTFPRQSVTATDNPTNIVFIGETPVLTTLKISSPFTGTVGGGSISYAAIAYDQFGEVLQQQPAITWTADQGTITTNGLFTTPATGSSYSQIQASCSNVTAFAYASGFPTSYPFLTRLSTNRGPVLGGTTVTVYGGNFTSNSSVLFGGLTAQTISVTSTSITCTLPDMSHSPLFTAGGPAPVSIADPNQAGTTLLNAFEFAPSGAQTFFATIAAGTTAGQSQVSRLPGAILPLVAAPAPPGQMFYAWSGGGSGSFSNPTSTNTLFTMPAHDVSIVATYKLIPTLPQTATPEIQIQNGVLQISCATTNADIYYTTDGSVPTTPSVSPTPNGKTYLTPWSVGPGVTIRAIASAANRPDSAVATVATSTIESWRLACFSTNATNLTTDNAADPDGDGLQNLFEYAFASNPMDSTSVHRPRFFFTNILNTIYPAVEFRRNASASDLEFTVQSSPDLTNWFSGSHYSWTNSTPVTLHTTEISRSGNPIEIIMVRGNTAYTNAAQQFLRVNVGLSP